MIDTYTSSKGEKILIKDMASPHLIHSIAKLAMAISEDIKKSEGQGGLELLNALKAEAIGRLTPSKEE